jgi:ATP-binding cassette subfamily C protein
MFRILDKWRKKPTRPARVKTPTLLQMEAVECGAAVLGIVLGCYGRIVPLPVLRRECGVSRDGSKASNMLRAARNYGLVAKGFKKELASVQELRPPFIVFWNFNHFLVVEGFRRGRVYLNDPASGPRTVTMDEFDQSFTGVVLVMEPGPDFTPGGSKPSTMRALQRRLEGSWGALAYCLVAGLLLVLPSLATAVFTQIFVDSILVQGLHDWLRPLLLGMILIALLRGLLMRLQLLYLRRLKLKLVAVLSSRFLWHLLHLPASFYAQRFAGEITNRINANSKVADVLSGRLATTIIDAIMMLFYAVVMLQYDVFLTSIGIGFAAINFLALQWISRQRTDTNMRLLQEHGKVGGVAIAGLQNMETLKASALESEFFARWAGYYAKATNAQQDLGVTNQQLGVLPIFLSAITTMFILVVGGLRVMEGFLSIGMLVAFLSLMRSFLAPVTNLVGLGSTLQELQGDLNRLDDVLDNPSDLPSNGTNGAQPPPLTPDGFRLQGYVEMRNVTFGYSPVNPPLIDNLSFTLKPGQSVALVGASGSGKSTVAKLASGLYEPWEGDILFDGLPRSQIPRQVLTHSVALVDQDLLLFSGTVRDNLTLWDSTVPSSNLVQAGKDAAVHDVVVAMSGGYDGELLEGAVNLSGGQRQRLEIARALVRNPAILILDEATSALDAETENIVVKNLRRRGCSCIVVAHRLSTIRDCDEIILLDHGKVVQRGTHQSLLQEEGGAYARLLLSEGEALQEI